MEPRAWWQPAPRGMRTATSRLAPLQPHRPHLAQRARRKGPPLLQHKHDLEDGASAGVPRRGTLLSDARKGHQAVV